MENSVPEGIAETKTTDDSLLDERLIQWDQEDSERMAREKAANPSGKRVLQNGIWIPASEADTSEPT